MAGANRASKTERFDFFRRALYLGCLGSSSYSTVYQLKFSHAIFSGVPITSTSEMDSFSEYT